MSFRTLLAGAALGALSTAALSAQAPTSAGAPFGLSAGTRVRLTLADSLVQLGRPGRPVGQLARVEGVFVSLDSTGLQMRLRDGVMFAFPAENVRALETRTGAGFCRRSTRARVACLVGGVAVGSVAGMWAGDKVGRHVIGVDFNTAEDATLRRRCRQRGLMLGIAGALALQPVLGRDRWVSVPGWPAARD